MRHFPYRCLAAVSLLVLWGSGEINARPRYGGTLRVEMLESIRSMNPDEWPANAQESAAKEKLISLLFEPLVRLDENDRPRPALAVSWQHDSQSRRWSFRLRPDVIFHNGSPLTPETAAAALQISAPDWKTSVQGDALLIESDTPEPDLLYDLSGARHSIFLRISDHEIAGTGPFELAALEAGRRAVLVANEQHWAGRPFLNSIVIEMGRSPADQRMDLELGKADLVEIWPNEMRRLPKEAKTWTSLPDELVALAFERNRPATQDPRVREALALSIDRSAIHNWLMQKQGEPAASLLPQYLSGYAFLFPIQTDAKKARQILSSPGQPLPRLVLAYDASDPLARSLADRIAVNGREAGITISVSNQQPNPDIRLVRLPIRTPLPGPALAGLISDLRLADAAPVSGSASIKAVQAAENAVLSEHRVIPLFHVPEIFGSSPRLKTWMTAGLGKFGDWHFEDMWLDVERP
jgi:peptide/nickel transport system substrate-binding protein